MKNVFETIVTKLHSAEEIIHKMHTLEEMLHILTPVLV